MAFEEAMKSIQDSVQDSFDALMSPRSSSQSKMRALQSLERNLASACFSTNNDAEAKDAFMALQYTFECNVPSHLLPWIVLLTLRLETLTTRGPVDGNRESEVDDVATQLELSLSLIQGVVLNHDASKAYMGRRSPLEILLDLLLASRHIITDEAESPPKSSTGPPPLTSIVLDTLLCILVDSPAALRAFEEASGVQAVVKILKRAGTPREVRMKCLEFLYFYLLDETPTSSPLRSTQPSPPPTRPATPIRPPKPYLNATPLRPKSRYVSPNFSSPSSTTPGLSSSASSRSLSGSSSHSSFSSTSSSASASTAASSIPATPVKESYPDLLPIPSSKPPRSMTSKNHTPPVSPMSPPAAPATKPKLPQTRAMMMLRKDVDYVPQSPKKVPGMRLSHRGSMSTSALSQSRSSLRASQSGSLYDEERSVLADDVLLSPSSHRHGSGLHRRETSAQRDGKWKTTEEKKELLGTMLGNVDALVEGVRKAGIWGLGNDA